mmetsp:Transcript_22648/g.66546  ORF Transcript_22648/g.66546 Transcript_22648/m.66546 type:complete len:469 (+) Transcript_22648:113-1519(+)
MRISRHRIPAGAACLPLGIASPPAQHVSPSASRSHNTKCHSTRPCQACACASHVAHICLPGQNACLCTKVRGAMWPGRTARLRARATTAAVTMPPLLRFDPPTLRAGRLGTAASLQRAPARTSGGRRCGVEAAGPAIVRPVLWLLPAVERAARARDGREGRDVAPAGDAADEAEHGDSLRERLVVERRRPCPAAAAAGVVDERHGDGAAHVDRGRVVGEGVLLERRPPLEAGVRQPERAHGARKGRVLVRERLAAPAGEEDGAEGAHRGGARAARVAVPAALSVVDSAPNKRDEAVWSLALRRGGVRGLEEGGDEGWDAVGAAPVREVAALLRVVARKGLGVDRVVGEAEPGRDEHDRRRRLSAAPALCRVGQAAAALGSRAEARRRVEGRGEAEVASGRVAEEDDVVRPVDLHQLDVHGRYHVEGGGEGRADRVLRDEDHLPGLLGEEEADEVQVVLRREGRVAAAV